MRNLSWEVKRIADTRNLQCAIRVKCARISTAQLFRILHKDETDRMSGMKATYRFRGEQVHAFESFPSASEASNEYVAPSEDERQNHSYSGKMDGGVAMPELKSSGPYAALVTALKARQYESAAQFLFLCV